MTEHLLKLFSPKNFFPLKKLALNGRMFLEAVYKDGVDEILNSFPTRVVMELRKKQTSTLRANVVFLFNFHEAKTCEMRVMFRATTKKTRIFSQS